VEAQCVWLLEGLTGYLTEEELLGLLQKIDRLSAPGSVILATWYATLVTSAFRTEVSLPFCAPPRPGLARTDWAP